MLNEPKIIWEKWIDPYGGNIDDVEWPGYNDSTEEDEDFGLKKSQKIYGIATTMGIIPYNEYTDCTKIFNFWTGHTNFSITQNIADIIEKIEGVETLDIFTRYRFRISFGKAFNDRDVINNINSQIRKIYEPNTRAETS